MAEIDLGLWEGDLRLLADGPGMVTGCFGVLRSAETADCYRKDVDADGFNRNELCCCY
jgi:hypothetical protein